jgi:ferredoxin
MSLLINEECINCGACQPECPNEAIYVGGEDYEYKGKTESALSDDLYYIVPEKCTECVGFHDEPERVDSQEELLNKANALHPDKEF